jgi:hypothetical protein
VELERRGKQYWTFIGRYCRGKRIGLIMTEHKNTPNKTPQGVLSRMWTRSLGSPSQQQQPQAHGEDAREEHLARNDGENLNGAVHPSNNQENGGEEVSINNNPSEGGKNGGEVPIGLSHQENPPNAGEIHDHGDEASAKSPNAPNHDDEEAINGSEEVIEDDEASQE